MLKKISKKVVTLATVLAVGSLSIVGCSSVNNAKEHTYKVTLVLTEGGVNDQSFNQSAWEGAIKAQEQIPNLKINYLESKQKSEYMSNIETAIDNGSDLVIGVGFEMTEAIGEAAKNYPEQRFAIVDGAYEETPSNVRSILFDEQQAGYAVGLIAGKMTLTNKLGFVGGMDIPSVSNFAVGFEKGIKESNSKAELSVQYANSFTDAAKGRAIAQQMIKNNCDIIFCAGGGVNNGVIEASKEADTKVIGVDMPMHHLMPDTVITSALKNVGTGVKLTIKDVVEEKFVGGEQKIYNLSNKGVGYEDTALIPEAIKEYVDSKLANTSK